MLFRLLGWAAAGLGALLWIVPGMYAQESHLAMGDGAPVWVIEGVQPGAAVQVPGVAHLTVVADDVWSLSLASNLASGDGRKVHSDVQPRLISDHSEVGGVTERGVVALEDQAPTDPGGRTFQVDFSLSPSWDDPPDLPFYVQLEAALVGEGVVRASYVSPSRWVEGSLETAAIWFRLTDNALGGGTDVLTLTVRTGGDPDAPTVTTRSFSVGGSGWQQVVIPNVSSLPVGPYRYQIESARGGRVAAGAFHVLPPSGGVAVAAQGVSASKETPGHAVATTVPAAIEQPEARLQVDPKRAAPGEPADWQVRVFNPGILSLLETALYVCLPSDWHVTAVDYPMKTAELHGRTCRTLHLGSISGRSQRQVSFSLMQWPPSSLERFSLGEKQTVQFYLFVRPPGAERAVLLRTVEASLFSTSTGMSTEVPVRGYAFVDRNGNEIKDDEEDGLSGAAIVVNGANLRRSNRDGSFTLRLRPGSYVIWARSERGRSRPRWMQVNSTHPPLVHLPIGVSHEREVRTQSEYYVASSVTSEDGDLDLDYRINAGHWAPWARIDWGADKTDVDARLELTGEVHRWEANWRRGVPERVRMGALRPSLSAESAWRIGLHVPPYAISGARPAVLSTGIEVGEAAGDFWGCRILWSGVDWSAGTTRLSADATRSIHVRMDERGERWDDAGHVSVEGTGGVFTSERWRYTLGLYAGDRRRLSPSCGETPRDGLHWAIGVHPPRDGADASAAIEVVQAAAGRWSSGARAFELALESARFSPSGDVDPVVVSRSNASFQLVPALQWVRERDDLEHLRVRPGLVARTWAGRHRLDVEWGHRPLRDADRELDVERGEGRRYVQWRWSRGRVGVSAALESYHSGEERHQVGEVGFSVRDPIPAHVVKGLTSSKIELGRSLSLTRRRDTLRVDARLADHDVRLSLNGRHPRTPDQPVNLALKGYDSVQASARVNGRFERFAHPDGRLAWSLEAGRVDSWDEQVREVSFSLEGDWSRGRWSAEVRRRLERGVLDTRHVSRALHIQATCGCVGWSLETELRRVAGASVPRASTESEHPVASLRLHGSRSVSRSLFGYVEYVWSYIDASWPGVTVTLPSGAQQTPMRSSLTLGLEWAPPMEVLPFLLGVGLQTDLEALVQGGSRPRFVIQVRTPILVGNPFRGE